MTTSVSVSSEGSSSLLSAMVSQPTVQASVLPNSMVLATGKSQEGVVTVDASDEAPIGTHV